MDEYNLNSAPRFTGTYKNASAVLTDPTTATATYTKPNGTTTTLTYGTDAALVKSSTGVYYVDLTLDQAGRWNITFAGTGTVTASDPYDFIVSTTHTYCTLDELKDELAITDITDDAKLARAINAASRQIDTYCGQRFWQDTAVVDRQFYADDATHLYLDDAEDGSGDGISTTTGLVVKVDIDGDGVYESTLTINTDFVLLPRNAQARYPVRPYTEVVAGLVDSSWYFPRLALHRPGVQITAKWGWPAVPDDVNKACLVQAAQLYKAKDTAFDVAGSNDFGAIRVRSGMNRTAEALLAGYQKPAVG